MKRRPVLLGCGLCIICLVIVLYHVNLERPAGNLAQEQVLSYEEYNNLYETAASSLNIGDQYARLIPERNTIDLTYIDKDASFGKRNYLTVDNTASDKVTQKRLEYLSQDEQFLIAIDFIYQPVLLENDMLYWGDPIDVEENEFVLNMYDGNLLAYRNILVNTSVFATGSTPIDPSMLTNITNQITSFLQNTVVPEDNGTSSPP